MATSTLGYSSLDEEMTLDRLSVEGTIPGWLSGSLLRNGPAKFEVGEGSYRHWFDGFAMLHRFTFHDGNVSYANKFLHSDTYNASMREGRIVGGSFASDTTDPCKAIFKPSMTEVVNASVSINKVADEFVALTETPLPVAFDPHTLETLGVVEFDDQLTGQHGSAHPHYDAVNHMLVSYMTEFNIESRFKVFAIKDGEQRRTLIGSYGVTSPAYIHSFGMSEHYVIIAEFPYRVVPLEILTSGKPFLENYRWYPEEEAHFIVMDKQDGRIVGRFPCAPFFTFHHANAFESGGELIVDLSAYPDPSIVNDLYLEQLRGNEQRVDSSASSEFRRYHLPLSDPSQPVRYELLSEQGIELPSINYAHYNTRDYGVVYGISMDKQHPEAVANQLARVAVRERRTTTWSESGCYPGEPIFVLAPGGQVEDDGVVLSVVLNAHKENSFLLVLDAHNFAEVGRAEVPHFIPFGFHGNYFPEAI